MLHCQKKLRGRAPMLLLGADENPLGQVWLDIITDKTWYKVFLLKLLLQFLFLVQL